ncbi:MAG TPA: DUF805 domain-containing protein [Bradyrhizobium sp.]|nr:DUF805 domain-containing protein [Bradyrhizobium sp.]
MGFTEAIASVFRNYATFSGRAPRSEYWYFALFAFLVGVATSIVDMLLFPIWTNFSPINSLASLALLLPSIAVGVRRLHDIDRTGWWVLIAFTVIGILLLLFWACVRGTPGPNRFGPDPLEGRYGG